MKPEDPYSYQEMMKKVWVDDVVEPYPIDDFKRMVWEWQEREQEKKNMSLTANDWLRQIAGYKGKVDIDNRYDTDTVRVIVRDSCGAHVWAHEFTHDEWAGQDWKTLELRERMKKLTVLPTMWRRDYDVYKTQLDKNFEVADEGDYLADDVRDFLGVDQGWVINEYGSNTVTLCVRFIEEVPF